MLMTIGDNKEELNRIMLLHWYLSYLLNSCNLEILRYWLLYQSRPGGEQEEGEIVGVTMLIDQKMKKENEKTGKISGPYLRTVDIVY